jgi:acetyl-CoA C-acetyltransferase
MTNCAVIGVGQTPVAEHWGASLRDLAGEAVQAALDDAGLAPNQIDALYVANTYGGPISSQAHLGALIADYVGLHGVEAFAVEAGEAAGGAALRTAVMAVASGLVNTALVVGVEKSTDMVGAARIRARSVTLDADYEAIHGATLPALAGMLMRRYMTEFGVELSAFEGFSINAHNNGRLNRYAMYRNTIKPGAFARAPMVADPVTLFDGAPDGDGAAAVVIARADRAADLVPQPVRIAGSGAATDTLALHERADLLAFEAVRLSAQRALAGAGLGLADIHLLELHDGFTIQTVLALEALRLAERGAGWRLAADSAIALTGRHPISTFGGLKARGNPVGATGVYQAVEAVLQLRGAAGPNQVANARAALIQNHGGLASTVITHVLTV